MMWSSGTACGRRTKNMTLWIFVQNALNHKRTLFAATFLLCIIGASGTSYGAPARRLDHGHATYRYRDHYMPARRSDHHKYYAEKYYDDYGKHDFEFLLPLLLLLLAPLAVGAFLLPVTASLMTNTLFLVNGVGPAAAIQGRRRREVKEDLSLDLVDAMEKFEKAMEKYGLLPDSAAG
ncbi:uncharacterized protein LOC135366244 [Ornithodoros turicata]|uniref:uncharacterized protein LOC135366244 n=1 Tax=Ornithodoros turicata TaxID=34597 RepID=UPI003139F416